MCNKNPKERCLLLCIDLCNLLFRLMFMYDVVTVTWAYLLCWQCSVHCGYGIQSRAVSCMGPSQPEPLSPLLCMHIPKPITIQGCYMGSCTHTADATAAANTEGKTNLTMETPHFSPTLSHKDRSLPHMRHFYPRLQQAMNTPYTTPTATTTPKTSKYTVTSQRQLQKDHLNVPFSRCVWKTTTGRIRYGRFERCNWPLHSIHRSTPRRGHSH